MVNKIIFFKIFFKLSLQSSVFFEISEGPAGEFNVERTELFGKSEHCLSP